MWISQSASGGVSGDREECFPVNVNHWGSASHDSLRALGSDGTVVTCTSGATRELRSNESRLFALLAAARSRDGCLERRTIAKCARQRKCGVVGTVDSCVQFDPGLVRCAKMEEQDFVDKMSVCAVVPRAAVESFAPCWVSANGGPGDQPPLRARWVAQSFAAEEETDTSTSLRHLT